jgi:Domain of unknown function (DUF4286)
MLIFNTTFLVSDRYYGSWLKWSREFLIPFMLESGEFTQPQVAKVLGADDEEGTSFSVQFHIADMDKLVSWNAEYAERFQTEVSTRFGEEVLFFSTILEIINN